MKKEIHLTGQDLMHMVQLRPGDLGKYTLIPGPMERLQTILKRIQNPVKNFSFMEYSMYTGTYDGIKVTAGNGGRFSADSAIITEIVCAAQCPHIIRMGSCGALDEKIKVGDLIIVHGVIRGEGVTPYYVSSDFKTVSDGEITNALIETAKKKGINFHQGVVWTTDALLRETTEVVEKNRKLGAIAVDMVCASLLTIAQLNRIKAGAVLVVSDNLITGELGFINPLYYDGENKMIDLVFEAIKTIERK